MELKEIAVVSGKPGLFRIVKPAINGVILEAMDGTGARFIAGTSTKVSVLGEISIYTNNGENVPLQDVFISVYSKYGKNLPFNGKSSDTELRKFFEEVVPEHDTQRVYHSDIKKIINWFNLLVNAGAESIFTPKQAEAEQISEGKKEKKGKKEPSAEVEIKEEAPKKETKTAAKKETTTSATDKDKKTSKTTSKKEGK